MNPVQAVILVGAAVAVGSIAPTPACADSWALPTTATHVACGGGARVTIIPRDLNDQLDYFEDKANGIDPAGQASRGQRFASARMERRVGGRWRTMWQRRLANDVAPVDAILRHDGAYLVTFDDWHAIGSGPNAVVVYGADGQRIRTLSLRDIVPDGYIEALPHSVSSIAWRGEPRFSADGRRALIPVSVPIAEHLAGPKTALIAVTLASGAVAPVEPLAWTRAQAVARAVSARDNEAAAGRRAAFFAPLTGPTENTQGAWHDYLREAVARRAADGVTPATKVLRLPGGADYAESATWLHDALVNPYADAVAIASPSEPQLVEVLATEAAGLRPGALSRVTLFIAVGDERWPVVRSALQPTGASLVQLAPGRPIPQRPDRIAARHGR